MYCRKKRNEKKGSWGATDGGVKTKKKKKRKIVHRATRLAFVEVPYLLEDRGQPVMMFLGVEKLYDAIVELGLQAVVRLAKVV